MFLGESSFYRNLVRGINLSLILQGYLKASQE